MPDPASSAPLLEVRGVSKAFPGVQALSDVSLAVHPGVVHAVVGENGAGKSTLMRVLAGVLQPDSGGLRWGGEPLVLPNPAAARDRGISIIYQEFNLFPDLSVAENIMFNREPRTGLRTVGWKAMASKARQLLGLLSADIDVKAEVRLLSVAQQQLVEVVKALALDAQLIIMDEPTAALNTTEVANLFTAIRHLRQQGRAVIFISHRLDEVFTISDVITVLKDGAHVASRPTVATNKDEVVRLMIGRSLQEKFPQRLASREAQPLLSVEDLTTAAVRGVSFTLNAGEILGIAGLEGHGQVQLARALFGLAPVRAGKITVAGQPVRFHHPVKALGAGLAFVSDDRKGEGLALMLSVRQNVALPNLGRFSRFGLVSSSREEHAVEAAVSAMGVRTPSMEQEVSHLSGGNQQKVILAKWLIGDPQIYVFVEPTRGIDVGTRVEIYRLMREFADQGRGIVMVSSDLPELLGMADRLLVMRNGQVAAEIPGVAASEERVMRAATGLSGEGQ